MIMAILGYLFGLLAGAIALFYIQRGLRSPSLTRNWEKHHAQLPEAIPQSDGSILVTNIRHARYRAEFDYDLSFVEETYDPKKITRVWYTLCPWGPLGFQAHAWLTFDFEDGRSLIFGAEVRKQNAFTFFAYKAIVGNFEIFYVVADELDVLYLRTHIWKNETRMYPLKLTQDQRSRIFQEAANRINHYAHTPEWYRVTYRQCNTEPMGILHAAGLPIPKWHPKYIIAGWCDQVLYSHGLIDDTGTFEEVKALSMLNLDLVGKISPSEHFSLDLRKYLLK
jgi:hypothetical protein